MPKKLKPRDLPFEALELIAERFRVLSEPSRLQLLTHLEEGEKNVSELIQATGIPQANVSRHLRVLTDSGLVTRRKEGVNAYYTIADQAIFELCEHVCGSLQKRLNRQGKAACLFGG